MACSSTTSAPAQVAPPPATPVPAACAVGLTGQTTEFAASGPGANAFCNQIVSSSQNVYRPSSAPSASEACQYTLLSGTLVTVYADSGHMPTLDGEDACARLRERSTDALPTDTPNPFVLTPTFTSNCSVSMSTNDAFVSVEGSTASTDCQTIVNQSKDASTTSAPMTGIDTQVCRVTDNNGNAITVYDSGAQGIGTQACQALRAGSLPSLQPA